jgi:acetoin utilization deacetylase AcuC-like enzyme
MRVIYSALHEAHAPQTYSRNGVPSPYKDNPARITSLLQVVRDLKLDVTAPRDFGEEPILRLHTAEYLTFLKTAFARWRVLAGASSGSELACADRYSVRHYQHSLPSSIQGQVGYFLSGSAVQVGEFTFSAVVAAVNTALEGAEVLKAGGRAAYALCRPPGHHAYPDLAGGYCFLNNAALAAVRLRETFPRVAILDIDVHHGNGTQYHFYRRSDVYFASVHVDPNHAYPFYSGYASERGEGDGEGTNLNVPFAVGTDDASYLESIRTALRAIRSFGPDALVISLGLDAHKDDPQQLAQVTTQGFGRAGTLIGELDKPTLLVQEGGYGVGDVGNSLAAFLAGFGASTRGPAA